MPLRIRRPSIAFLLIPLLATCGGETGPGGPKPTAIKLLQGPPGVVQQGVAIAPAIRVGLVGSSGDAAEVDGVAVTVSLNGAGRTLGGTVSVLTDEEGVAEFSDLSITGPVGFISLTFASPELTSATTIQFSLGAGAPASIERLSVDTQTAQVTYQQVTASPQVRVRDIGGNTIIAASVTATVLAGGGALTVPPEGYLTDASGAATITGWQLGAVPAVNTLQVQVTGHPEIAPILFTATGVVGPVAVVELSSVAGPVVVDTLIPGALVATLKDARGNRLPDLEVTFAATPGPASSQLTGTVQVSDDSGRAILGGWHLGTLVGTYGVTATAGTITSAASTVQAVAAPPTRIVRVGSDSLVRRAGLSDSVRFRTTDRFGNGVSGVGVDFLVTSGAGTLGAPSGVSGSDGRVAVTLVPTTVGPVSVTGTLTPIPDSSVTLTVKVVAPTEIVAIAGDEQTGQGASLIPVTLTFEVRDENGAGVAGVPVVVRSTRGYVTDRVSDSLGAVALTGLTFPNSTGTILYRASSPWVTGDTGQLVLHATAGALDAFDSVSAGGPYQVMVQSANVPVFRARDAAGVGIAGLRVGFVGSGNFTVDTGVTDSLGFVSSGAFTPQAHLTDRIIGVYTGLISRLLTIDVRPGPVASMVRVGTFSSRPLHGLAGERLVIPTRIMARDAYGNIPDPVSVGAAIISGGGAVNETFTLDSVGEFSVSKWTMGAAGTNTLRLSAGVTTLDLTVAAPPASPFNITLRGVGAGYQPYFDEAVYNWRRRITADIPQLTFSIGASACGTPHAGFTGSVDDLMIDVTIAAIDGPGAILGGAGPCVIRGSAGLPAMGVMIFDAADVAGLIADETFFDVVLHEMGHVLGVGSLWDRPGLLSGAGGGDPRYIAAGGVTGWTSLGASGEGGVPVENSGGPGTRDSHWRESTIPSELMTGYLSALVNPLSAITVRSLTDLGYAVDPSTADPYTLYFVPPADQRRTKPVVIRDEVFRPRFSGDGGALTPVPAP